MIQIVCFCLMKTCILKMHGNWFYLIFLRLEFFSLSKILHFCSKATFDLKKGGTDGKINHSPVCLHICLPLFLQLSKKYCEGNLDLDFRIFFSRKLEFGFNR